MLQIFLKNTFFMGQSYKNWSFIFAIQCYRNVLAIFMVTVCEITMCFYVLYKVRVDVVHFIDFL